MSELRRCGKCLNFKSTQEFSKSKNKKGGLQCHCKDCKSLLQAKSKLTKRGRGAQLISTAKHSAKSKGLAMNLTIDWLLPKLERGVCERTGLKFDFHSNSRGKNRLAPSLDRIEPELGYVKGNVVLVIWQYNAAKITYSHEDLIDFCRACLSFSDTR